MSPEIIPPAESRARVWVSAFLPLVLLGILLLVFLKFGPLGVFSSQIAPIENIYFEKVILSSEKIELDILNDGPEPVTIGQVMVNDAYWQYSITPTQTLEPLEKATITLAYPWLEGDFEAIKIISSNGVVFEKEIEVAQSTPIFNFHYAKAFILLGIYVGVIPVLLGLLWLPFLKTLKARWYGFLLALTIGLLVFLGFDAIAEAIELLGDLPQSYNGIGILVIGFLLAIITLSAVSYKMEHYKAKEEHHAALVWGYLIALGIGLHNLGEGLAIGSAYAIGEVALGSLLVIGFMIHNVTEGVAILAPLARLSSLIRNFYVHLILMGIIAGGPTILGSLIGGLAYSPSLAVFFLAIGAGAIFDVAFDITHHMAKGKWISLFTFTNASGFLAGLLVMYITGLLVVG